MRLLTKGERILIAAAIAYFAAAWVSEFVFIHELNVEFGHETPDSWLTFAAPAFVPLRFVATSFGRGEYDAEFRVQFAVLVLVFGVVYVGIRYMQDRQRHGNTYQSDEPNADTTPRRLS